MTLEIETIRFAARFEEGLGELLFETIYYAEGSWYLLSGVEGEYLRGFEKLDELLDYSRHYLVDAQPEAGMK